MATTYVFKRDDEMDGTLKLRTGDNYSIVKGVVEITNKKDADYLEKVNPVYKLIETKE